MGISDRGSWGDAPSASYCCPARSHLKIPARSEQSQCCLQTKCLAKLAGAKGPDQAEEVPIAVGDIWRVAALSCSSMAAFPGLC